jgi:hypothetical protein
VVVDALSRRPRVFSLVPLKVNIREQVLGLTFKGYFNPPEWEAIRSLEIVGLLQLHPDVPMSKWEVISTTA